MQVEPYRHSGLFPIHAPLIVLVAGVLISGLGGFLYMFLTDLVPYVYINAVLTVGYVFVLGYSVIWIGEWGKIRNLGLISLLAAVVGMLGLYSSWVGLSFILAGKHQVLLNPADLLNMGNTLVENGRWVMDETVVKGLVVLTVWTLEALGIVCGSIYLVFNHFRNLPFCENCNLWVKKALLLGPFVPHEDETTFKEQIGEGMIEPLFQIKQGQANPLWLLALLQCKRCENFHLASLDRFKFDKKGNSKKKSIFQNLLLNKESFLKLSESAKAETPNTVVN